MNHPVVHPGTTSTESARCWVPRAWVLPVIISPGTALLAGKEAWWCWPHPAGGCGVTEGLSMVLSLHKLFGFTDLQGLDKGSSGRVACCDQTPAWSWYSKRGREGFGESTSACTAQVPERFILVSVITSSSMVAWSMLVRSRDNCESVDSDLLGGPSRDWPDVLVKGWRFCRVYSCATHNASSYSL